MMFSRVYAPNSTRQVGYQHGMATKRSVPRDEVKAWSPGWSDDEIDAYMEGRKQGATDALMAA